LVTAVEPAQSSINEPHQLKIGSHPYRAFTIGLMESQNKLLSNVGIDYTPLFDLLVARQWKAADEKTALVMLEIADRVKDGWLREIDITNFPILDLQTIDSLWVKHSQERFGFSVQSRIWQNVDGDYAKFSDAVEWRLNYTWQKYSSLTFKVDAPVGHLPAAPFFKSDLAIGWTATFVPKLTKCHTNEC
jgi:hypothetical protein